MTYMKKCFVNLILLISQTSSGMCR